MYKKYGFCFCDDGRRRRRRRRTTMTECVATPTNNDLRDGRTTTTWECLPVSTASTMASVALFIASHILAFICCLVDGKFCRLAGCGGEIEHDGHRRSELKCRTSRTTRFSPQHQRAHKGAIDDIERCRVLIVLFSGLGEFFFVKVDAGVGCKQNVNSVGKPPAVR